MTIKRVLSAVKEIAAIIIILFLVYYAFFGAVLQESYKLCPVTASEVIGK